MVPPMGGPLKQEKKSHLKRRPHMILVLRSSVEDASHGSVRPRQSGVAVGWTLPQTLWERRVFVAAQAGCSAGLCLAGPKMSPWPYILRVGIFPYHGESEQYCNQILSVIK